MKKFFLKKQGFTLFEMVLTISIIGIISLVATGIVVLTTQTNAQIINRSILLIEGRNAINLIRSDLQKIAPDSIWTMKAKRLYFDDIDGNAIEYRYLNNVLTKNNSTVAEFLQANPFQYFDKDMIKTTDPTELSFIRIRLKLEWKSETVQIEEVVYVRNKTKI